MTLPVDRPPSRLRFQGANSLRLRKEPHPGTDHSQAETGWRQSARSPRAAYGPGRTPTQGDATRRSQSVLADLGLEHPLKDSLALGEIFHRFKAADELGLGEGDLELPIARFALATAVQTSGESHRPARASARPRPPRDARPYWAPG